MVAPLATASLMDDGRGTGGAYLRITNWKIPRRWRNLVERMRSGIFGYGSVSGEGLIKDALP